MTGGCATSGVACECRRDRNGVRSGCAPLAPTRSSPHCAREISSLTASAALTGAVLRSVRRAAARARRGAPPPPSPTPTPTPMPGRGRGCRRAGRGQGRRGHRFRPGDGRGRRRPGAGLRRRCREEIDYLFGPLAVFAPDVERALTAKARRPSRTCPARARCRRGRAPHRRRDDRRGAAARRRRRHRRAWRRPGRRSDDR